MDWNKWKIEKLHSAVPEKVAFATLGYIVWQIALFWLNFGQESGILLTLQCKMFLGILALILHAAVYQWFNLLTNDYESLSEIEEKAMKEKVLSWTPPSKALVEANIKPTDMLFKPEFFGLENIPTDKPILFVGNHALLGVEMPLLISHVYQKKNIFMRGLADTFHFSIPIWGDLLMKVGAVVGSRSVCSALMEKGENILVYPGGANEVLKKKADDKYELKWKDRTGFARLAIQHGYTIIPVCAVGSNEMLDILADIPVGWAFGKSAGSRSDLTIPIVKPPSPSQLQRIYFSFGKPIETSQLQGDSNIDNCRTIRNQCKAALEDEIASARSFQQSDPQRHTSTRLRQFIETITKKE